MGVRGVLRALAIVLVWHAARSTAVAAPDAMEGPAAVGIARMLPDGTIIMDLFQNDRVATAEGRFRLHPTDRAYKDLVEHLHGLKPGERKAIPPWAAGEDGPR